MYKKGTGNDKQGKDAGNRTLCRYRNFSQASMKESEALISFLNKLGTKDQTVRMCDKVRQSTTLRNLQQSQVNYVAKE